MNGLKIWLFIGVIACSIVLPKNAYTQNAQKAILEIGGTVGLSKYFGDLNQRLFSPGIHSAWGIFLRYNANKHLALRTSLLYTRLQGNDAHSRNIEDRIRNLSFTTVLPELSLTGEVYLTDRYNRKLSPYLQAGIGVFYFNPTTKYKGANVQLQPLGTEGQGIEGYPSRYSRTAIAGIIGAGVSYNISPKINLAFEIAYRFTSTNYLDDVGGVYPNRGDLHEHNEPLAAFLTDRSQEAALKDQALMQYIEENYGGISVDENGYPYIPGLTDEGNFRGNNRSDQFLIVSFAISYTIK
ncbi:DUF6089 family protein [Cytophagaceae bacterium ABcell3]|nr:DUF6089 family protein [Cytophagaceae bacterium ABcell3]